MAPLINGVKQIAISVSEVGPAVAFYADILGLPVVMKAPSMAFLDCGGVRLYLACGEGTEHQKGSACIYFQTTNMTALLGALKARNVSIHQEPQVIARMPDHDLWLMWIRDQDGNLLGVMEERMSSSKAETQP